VLGIVPGLGCLSLLHPARHQFQAAADCLKQVVEVVRNAAGQLTQNFHLLRLPQRRLNVLAVDDLPM
jgi:hypothetical protein